MYLCKKLLIRNSTLRSPKIKMVRNWDKNNLKIHFLDEGNPYDNFPLLRYIILIPISYY